MRVRDERGVALPSPLVLLSVVAVAMAGLAFAVTSGDDDGGMQTVSKPSASAEPSATPKKTTPPKPKKKQPAVQRGKVYVEVYNNSGISGLAGSTAQQAQSAGWQVVGSDNWYGTIPSSTVYYPERLQRAAKLLAKDLGIRRVVPAVDPMRLDRLTVILTADYQR